MSMKFVIKRRTFVTKEYDELPIPKDSVKEIAIHTQELWEWSLVQDNNIILQNDGFHSEKMCRNNINQVKKVSRFTKVELINEIE